MSPCSFAIEGLNIQALRWQTKASQISASQASPTRNKTCVLALHGWLDNAASFSLLAPKLIEQNSNVDSGLDTVFDIVALDLAGHGRSDFRPGLSAYNIWQDLGEIYQIVKQLGWDKFSIIGHSRGAMIATLYAGTFPEQVSGLCLLDAVTPRTTAADDLPQQLRSSIKQLLRVNDKTSTYYQSYDDAAMARMQGLFPLSEAASRLLAERGVERDEQYGYYWRYDKCLLIASEVRFTEEQVLAFVNALKIKALVVLASEGLVYDCLDENTAESIALENMLEHENLHVVELDGEHHIQLSEDENTLNLLAKEINDYLYSC